MGRLSNEERARRAAATQGETAQQVLSRAKTEPQEPVRPEVKRMSGHESEAEMAAGLPDNTMTAAPEAIKRTRRTKAEMETLRSQGAADPNLSDKRYVSAIAKMNAFGGPKLVKGTFAAVGLATGDKNIPLNQEESDDLEDYFYVLSKKYNVLDPTRHWVTMAVFFFGMLGSFILTRVLGSKSNSLAKQIAGWFTHEEGENEGKAESQEPTE
jgi:hypothetical protein